RGARSHAVRAADARAPGRVDARCAAGRHAVGRRGVSYRPRHRDARGRQSGRPDRHRRGSPAGHRGHGSSEPGHEGWRHVRRSPGRRTTMSQRHRTGDSDSHSTSARSGLTRGQWLTGAAAGVGLGTVGGLGRRPAFAQGTPKRGGTLRVATVDKPVNMDPGFAQLYSSLQVYQNVYSKLVNVDEAGQFVPGLAKSWKQENDRTWLFDLVDNAVFHTGEPLTAKDVVFTFTR